MSDPQIQQRFDRLLSSYQKISLFLALPALISSFSCVVRLFAANYNLSLAHAYLQGLMPVFTENGPLWCLLISLGVLGIFIALALFAAKGKIWCFGIAVGLHVADTVYGLTLFNALSPVVFSLSLIIHGVFLAAYVLGIIYYVKASRLLKEHPKDILNGPKDK